MDPYSDVAGDPNCVPHPWSDLGRARPVDTVEQVDGPSLTSAVWRIFPGPLVRIAVQFSRWYVRLRRQFDTVNRSLHREVEAFDTPTQSVSPVGGLSGRRYGYHLSAAVDLWTRGLPHRPAYRVLRPRGWVVRKLRTV